MNNTQQINISKWKTSTSRNSGFVMSQHRCFVVLKFETTFDNMDFIWPIRKRLNDRTCVSFYKLGGMGLALTTNPNFHGFHIKMGVIFFNKTNGPKRAQMNGPNMTQGPNGPNTAQHGPNECAQQGPGPNAPNKAKINGPKCMGPARPK